MAQHQNPQTPQPTPTPSLATPAPTLATPGERIRRFLNNIWEPLDQIGKAVMGDWWRSIYLSIQDAIALSLLLQIPSFIGKWILGKSFSDFGVCLQENALGPTRYACFIIVAADFLLWIVIAGRILGRFWTDLIDLLKKRGSGHGSQP